LANLLLKIHVSLSSHVYGQKANDGILVGANAVSEFIDEDQIEYLYENDSQTDIVAETDSQTPSQSES
jgi:hypothetical protein